MIPAQLVEYFDRISEAPNAIPRLRRFVLDLAIRGKLVEQTPQDEPASDLLRRIQAEKIKRGRVEKPKKETATSTDGQNFALPSGWVWASLGELVTVLNGRAYSQNELLNKGTPVLRVGNLFTSQHWYYSDLELPEDKYCEEGDLIFSWSASFGPFIWQGPKVIYHYHIWKLALHSERDLDKLYLYHLLSQKTQEIKDSGHGISMLHMTKEKMERLKVPLPPLREQHRIVAKVDELMALCTRLAATREEYENRRDRLAAASVHHLTNGEDAAAFRRHATFHINNLQAFTSRPQQLNRLRQAIRNLAVRGYLVPQDPANEPASEFLKRTKSKKSDNGPFPLPSTWAWISVGQLAEARLGKMLDKAKNKGTPRRYLRNVNVRWFDFDLSDVFEMRFEDDEIEEFSLRRGDVLICEGGEPGRAAVWDERENKIYFQKAIHRVRFPEGVDPYFFVNALRESADSGRLSEYFTGVGIKHFTGKGLSSFLFPLAPLAEQGRIVAKVNELMGLCDSLETQLTTARDESHHLLEAVLQHALIDDSPRSELAQPALPT
jgi:type I restriction enzyme, S subunit